MEMDRLSFYYLTSTQRAGKEYHGRKLERIAEQISGASLELDHARVVGEQSAAWGRSIGMRRCGRLERGNIGR
jgi:hypothetical protein